MQKVEPCQILASIDPLGSSSCQSLCVPLAYYSASVSPVIIFSLPHPYIFMDTYNMNEEW